MSHSEKNSTTTASSRSSSSSSPVVISDDCVVNNNHKSHTHSDDNHHHHTIAGDVTPQSQQKLEQMNVVDGTPPAVPQWRLDFLAKKKALQQHQRKLEERTLREKAHVQQQSTTLTKKKEAVLTATSNNASNKNELYESQDNSSMIHRNNDNSSSNRVKHSNDNNTSINSNYSAAENNSADKTNQSSIAQYNTGPNLNSYQSTEVSSNCVDIMKSNNQVDSEADAEEINVETDSDSIGSSLDGDQTSASNLSKKGKSGGYSFETGKRLDQGDSESSSEESESVGTESETEGSTELTYRPGFVSKLLNKFSTISYQGQPVTSSSSFPFYKTLKGSHNSHPVNANKASPPAAWSPPAVLSPPHSPRPIASSNTMVGSTSTSKVSIPHQKVNKPQTAHQTLPLKSMTVRSTSMEDLQKTASYRAPHEIILIEGPHENKIQNESANMSPEHAEPLPPLPKSDANKKSEKPKNSIAVNSPTDQGNFTTAPDVSLPPAQSVRERVQQAKAVFEKSSVPVRPRSLVKESPKSPAVEEVTKRSPTSAPEIVIITKDEIKPEDAPKSPPVKVTSHVPVKPPRKKRFGPLTSPVEPLFTSVKLKPTKHKLYQRNTDSDLGATSQTHTVGSPKPQSPVEVVKVAEEANQQLISFDEKSTADNATSSGLANAGPRANISLVGAGGRLHSSSNILANDNLPANESLPLSTTTNKSPQLLTATDESTKPRTTANDSPLLQALTVESPPLHSAANESPPMRATANESPSTCTTANKSSPTHATANKSPPIRATATKSSPTRATANESPPMRATANKSSPTQATSNESPTLHSLANNSSPTQTTANESPSLHTLANKSSPTQATANESPSLHALANKSSPTQATANESPPLHALANKSSPTRATANESPPLHTLANKSSPTQATANESPPSHAATNIARPLPQPASRKLETKIATAVNQEETGSRLQSPSRITDKPNTNGLAAQKSNHSISLSDIPSRPSSTSRTSPPDVTKSAGTEADTPASEHPSPPTVSTRDNSECSNSSVPHNSAAAEPAPTSHVTPTAKVKIVAEPTELQGVTSRSKDTTTPGGSKPFSAANSHQSPNQVASNKAKSLNDIPGPSKRVPVPSAGSAETDLQAVLRKRKEKTSSNELPVTNIDEMIAAPRRGSGTVLDTRKSMGSKRKVPEYEKIHEGPTLSFTDTKVVVGKGCLKVPSDPALRKNLSFNDLELSAVHEYPSEKVMIQQIAKEEGAVYWDDPDHLQAAPDRSVDEPEPEATSSSLRSSLKGNPGSTGSLGSHKPSYHGEYTIGQGLPSIEQSSNSQQYEEAEESPSLKIKPAEEHELKSWSSDGSSDILF